MNESLFCNAFTPEDHFNLSEFIAALEETHQDLQRMLKSNPNCDPELEQPIAIIENLIFLIADETSLETLELNKSMAVMAHLTLLDRFLEEMDLGFLYDP